MHFETNVDHGTHSTVAGMPSLERSTNRVTLEAGEWLEIVVNTKSGPRTFNLVSSGHVVGFSDDQTEDGILFKPSGNVALLGNQVYCKPTQK